MIPHFRGRTCGDGHWDPSISLPISLPFAQKNPPEPSQENHLWGESHTSKEIQNAILVYSRRPTEPQQCQSLDPKQRSRMHTDGTIWWLDQMKTLPIPAQAAISDSSQNTPTNSISALVVHKSNESTTLLSHTISEDHWIVDTGTSDHMFFLLWNCDTDIEIFVLDGSISKAAVLTMFIFLTWNFNQS